MLLDMTGGRGGESAVEGARSKLIEAGKNLHNRVVQDTQSENECVSCQCDLVSVPSCIIRIESAI